MTAADSPVTAHAAPTLRVEAEAILAASVSGISGAVIGLLLGVTGAWLSVFIRFMQVAGEPDPLKG